MYIAHVSTYKVLKALSKYKLSVRQVIAVMDSKTKLCTAATARNTGANPFSFR